MKLILTALIISLFNICNVFTFPMQGSSFSLPRFNLNPNVDQQIETEAQPTPKHKIKKPVQSENSQLSLLECPKIDISHSSICKKPVNQCWEDIDCSGKAKCCASSCGKKCLGLLVATQENDYNLDDSNDEDYQYDQYLEQETAPVPSKKKKAKKSKMNKNSQSSTNSAYNQQMSQFNSMMMQSPYHLQKQAMMSGLGSMGGMGSMAGMGGMRGMGGIGGMGGMGGMSTLSGMGGYGMGMRRSMNPYASMGNMGLAGLSGLSGLGL